MRDLLFKNLTSDDKKRRRISSSEIVDKQGMRSIIRRHFVCVVKELKDAKIEKPKPYLYVRKERSIKEKNEKFFCRIKGSIYAINQGRLFLVLYMHSLKIKLLALPGSSVQIN